MKLVDTHLVPGGVVKVYDDNKSKTAKFEISLTAEAPSDHAAMTKIARDLDAVSKAIFGIANNILDHRSRQTLSLKVDKETRRAAFLESHRLIRTGPDSVSAIPLDSDADDSQYNG